MKKVLALITLLTIIVATLATPVSAATYEDCLDYAFTSANGVKIFSAGTATKTPVIDGKIDAGEYTSSYTNTAYIPMTSASMQKLAEDFNSNVAAKVAKESIAAGILDMEKLVKDSKLTFNFAQDADNIYIGVKFDAGVEYNVEGNVIKTETAGDVTFKSIKHVLSRYALNYRFGFNIGEVDEYIEIKTNQVRGDLMTAAKATMQYAFAGAAGTDIKSEGVITAMYRTVIANETGYLNNSVSKDALVKAGEVIDHNNPGTDYTVYDEICINKKALLKLMGDYSAANLEEMPNAMYFAASINGQLVGTKADGTRGWLSDGGGGFYMFTGVPTKDFDDFSMNAVYPDLIVFTDKTTVAKADIKTGAKVTTADTTTAPATTTPTTTAPDTTAADTTAADTTTAATTAATTEAETGCGGTITVAGIALVAALGTCAVFVEKKRK